MLKELHYKLKERVISLFEDWFLYYNRSFSWKSFPDIITSLDYKVYKLKEFAKECFLSGYAHRYDEERKIYMYKDWVLLDKEPDNLPEQYTSVLVILKHIPLVKSKLGKARPYIIVPAYLNSEKQWREWYPTPVTDAKIITDLVKGWSYYPELPKEFKE